MRATKELSNKAMLVFWPDFVVNEATRSLAPRGGDMEWLLVLFKSLLLGTDISLICRATRDFIASGRSR